MRSFATIPPSVWQTDIKKLRGDVDAIAVHYHLTTSSHSTMIGIYPLPLMYLAYELGSPLEGASKGLRRVCEAGIATYDEEAEIVWVHEMAATQIAPRLSPKDNRVLAVSKQLAALPICQITLGFYGHYREIFHLRDQPILEEYERALQGASEPLRSKEKDKEQDKDLGPEAGKFSTEEEELGSGSSFETSEEAYAPRPSLEESRRFLIEIGVPGHRMETALQRLMREALFPCDVIEWKRETQEMRGAA
ncbi:hypothetical protein ABFT80_06095 [Mesorhizobium sp. SB112]|uniref:hypothetical protein n=1 Tax=Mesorhizobium sp. SB112 TaxID=3151853 RepID=UPI003266BD9E